MLHTMLVQWHGVMDMARDSTDLVSRIYDVINSGHRLLVRPQPQFSTTIICRWKAALASWRERATAVDTRLLAL